MELSGGREIRRRDSDSSTDSWSVVNRSTSAASAASTNLSSISYCSSFRGDVEKRDEQEDDQLSESGSEMTTEDSDLEIEENLSDEDELEEEEEAEEAEEDPDEGEDEIDEDDEQRRDDLSEGEEEEEEDDQMSLVDEDEVMDEAALHFVAAEKTSKRLDILAKQLESPFDQWIGGERNRPFVFGSLLICSAFGMAILQIIGSTWLANLPRTAAHHQSVFLRGDGLELSPLDVGLQSRRLGRLQHFAPMQQLNSGRIEAIKAYERIPSRQSLTYGNCTRDQLRKEWAQQAVKALIQWANNFTDNQCALRELLNRENIEPLRNPSIPPSISASPQPSFVQRKVFRPTISRPKRPSMESSPRPTNSPPPPPVSWRKRQNKPTPKPSTQPQQCPRLVEAGKMGKTSKMSKTTVTKPEKIMPSRPVEKKSRHYTKTSEGIARRGFETLKPMKTQNFAATMPRKSSMRFRKTLFTRSVPHKMTKPGPTPPPKDSQKPKGPTSVQQYRPTIQYKPCKSRPQPCWKDFQMNPRNEKKEKTSLVHRKEYSLARSIAEKKKNSLRKYKPEVCYGYSNTSKTEINRKMNKRARVQGYCSTISRSKSMSRLAEPQCDHRLWNVTKHERKPKRAHLEHKRPLPCRENNKLDKQIHSQQQKRKKLRRN